MFYGAKVYYEILTGKVLQVVSPQAGDHIVPTTKKEDFELYSTLKGRIPATVGALQLEFPYGRYAEEFATMVPVKVNVMTGSLQFSNRPEDPDTPVVTPVSDRLDQAEFALMDTLMATVRVGISQQLASLRADGVDDALVDLVLQHTALQLGYNNLKSEVEIYREVTTALLMEVTLLKGGGEDG